MHKHWSALFWGALLLVMGSGSASAAARPQFTLTVSSSQAKVRQPIWFRLLVKNLAGPKRYLFRVKDAGSAYHPLAQPGSRPTAVLKTDSSGTYWVQGLVLVGRGPHHNHWQTAWVSPPRVIYVGPVVSLQVAKTSVAQGSTDRLSAVSSGVFHPRYRFVARQHTSGWIPLGPFSVRPHLSWDVRLPGLWQIAVQTESPGGGIVESTPSSVSVYGPASAIQLVPSQKVWVADGLETELLTATVVDAEGDPVTDYQGHGLLQLTQSQGAIAAWGNSTAQLTPAATGTSLPLRFVNGSASVVLQAGTAISTDALTASIGTGITGSLNISAVAQVASQIGLATSSQWLIANESGNPANYSAEVLDQVGEPMLSGTYALTARLDGPGQFQDLTAGPDTVTYTGGQGPAPVTVYSIAGSLGPVTLTLSYPGLASANLTVPAILGGQPYQMGVSASQTTLRDGQSTTLTLTQLTRTGQVCDPASLDNSGYVVSITNANGSPASGFTLDGATYTGPTSFAVATGPNFFYAVSQPVTLGVTTANPGTYLVTVADADGLWKTSAPLTITVEGS